MRHAFSIPLLSLPGDVGGSIHSLASCLIFISLTNGFYRTGKPYSLTAVLPAQDAANFQVSSLGCVPLIVQAALFARCYLDTLLSESNENRSMDGGMKDFRAAIPVVLKSAVA